jgi:hypothetical protein
VKKYDPPFEHNAERTKSESNTFPLQVSSCRVTIRDIDGIPLRSQPRH